ncbi:MAG: cob(I)yrinic acid a,c-diamide adenosyltransferase [Flavobacteriales bacterium]|nr:cob(I)yrinic acid a,c-diamide adenosyltransferase [Flavobacteriales bacterium]
MKIYTKTGDLGETSLIGGVRVKKSNIRIEAYGSVDELNSWFGILQNIEFHNEKDHIKQIQDTLFTIGSHLASHPEKAKMKLPELNEDLVKQLERSIDQMESELEPLKNFILPGSSMENAYCHIARTVCRRCERRIVELGMNETINELIVKYMNRLSDYLFVLSRYVTFRQKGEDIPWNALR